MMACAQEVVIVADHTKFGRLSLSKLCDLDAIDAVVVDPALPDAFPPPARSGRRDPARRPARRGSRRSTHGPRASTEPPGPNHEHSLATPDRASIERIVRSILEQKVGANGKPSNGHPAAYRPNLVVNISARHAHLKQDDVNILFGDGISSSRR